MTAISSLPVQSNIQNPNFQSRRETRLIDIQKYPNYEVRTYETSPTTGKKWGVGIASYLCTGLGQAINGDWGKGIGFFLGGVLTGAGAGLGVFTKKPAAIMAGGLGALAIKIWSIVDAVNNAKSESTQIIPVNKQSNPINLVA